MGGNLVGYIGSLAGTVRHQSSTTKCRACEHRETRDVETRTLRSVLG
jgi:hypothetical protein